MQIPLDHDVASTDHAGRAVLDNLQTAVLVIDDQQRVAYLNQAGEILLGASARQLRGQLLGHLLHDPAMPALVAETLERQQPVLRHDLNFELPGNPAKRFNCWLTPLDGPDAKGLLSLIHI